MHPSPTTWKIRPYAPWPHHDPDEVEAVVRVLESGRVNYWTGEEGRAFEAAFAAATDCPHAVAVSNGTTALELALHALDLPPGSEVVTSPRTFIASASAIVRVGCVPVLADVDRESGNITAATIAPVLGPRTRALLPVHLAGWPCDMDPILDLARAHGLAVVEDCAQAQGATYRGRPVGSLGDLGAFSFCQDKIITTGGEGGMLTTRSDALWSRAWSFKDHGKGWEAVLAPPTGPGFRWLHESFGTNWRMTEPQAAIGRLQLAKLPAWIGRRRAHMARLNAAFRRHPCLRVPEAPPEAGHAAYKAYAYVRPERLRPGWDRDRVLAALVALGVPVSTGICGEIYREEAFRRSGLGPAAPLPVARELAATSLMFQVHPTLTEENLADTETALDDVLGGAEV